MNFKNSLITLVLLLVCSNLQASPNPKPDTLVTKPVGMTDSNWQQLQAVEQLMDAEAERAGLGCLFGVVGLVVVGICADTPDPTEGTIAIGVVALIGSLVGFMVAVTALEELEHLERQRRVLLKSADFGTLGVKLCIRF